MWPARIRWSTYTALEHAPAVLLAGLEPQDESPIVFLRLRKAVRRRHTPVFSVAALASPGLVRLGGTLLLTPPGGEAVQLDRSVIRLPLLRPMMQWRTRPRRCASPVR